MKILGIETVTKIGSLALVTGGKILDLVTIDTQLKHTANLIQALNNLLHSVNTELSAIDAIAVDRGPGSFTGIRVGIASAQGLAQPDNKPLVGICSLEALCYQILEGELPTDTEYLIPFIDAKRGEIYTGWYGIAGKKIRPEKKPYTTTLPELIKQVPPRSYLFGPDISRLKSSLPEKLKCPLDTQNTYPHAGTIALIAEQKISAGQKQKSIVPMYIYDRIVNRTDQKQ